MTEEMKVAVFQPYLDKFETEEMKLYCTDMIKLIPDYIFTMPSSTTGKFHNATQCQQHGQIYHILMFAEIMNYRLALKCNQEKFKSPTQRDAMRCVPIFHDAVKCGWDGSAYTVHEHPMLAGQWVRETKVEHDIDDKIKDVIACMCERHSGEWTTNKRSKVVLPEPENAMEVFCHECDILSSRNNIDMAPPEYLSDIFKDVEVPTVEFDPETTFTFGKYKGEKMLDVYDSHPDYVDWCLKEIHKTDIQQTLKAMKKYLEKDSEMGF